MNIYCTKKLSGILKLLDVYSPETSMQHWIANTFKTGNTDWILFTDIATLYSVLIILDDEVQNNVVEKFEAAFKAQLKSDLIWSKEFRKSFDDAMKTIYIYAGLEKSTQNISNSIVHRLKDVFEDSQSINSVIRYAKKSMNEIPWKVIKFQNPKELMSTEIQNYR